MRRLQKNIVRHNPVAAALRSGALKNRVVPSKKRNVRREKDKLRESLRDTKDCRFY